MNEQERREAQKRLDDEERRRRMTEGGEEMRAEQAMEDSERASRTGERREGEYLSPQEEQQRRMMQGTEDVNRGLGESQRAEQAMWGRQSEEELRLRDQTLRDTAPDTDRPKRVVEVEAPAGGGYGMTPARSSEVKVTRGRMSEEEMRRTGSDQVGYPAGSGSYYSETFEKPTGTTGPESSFGRVEGEPRAAAPREEARPGGVSGERMLSREEMLRSGSDQTAYRAGSGSYYSETFEKPIGTAGPETSFGRTEYMPSGKGMAGGGAPTEMATMGAMSGVGAGTTTAKMKETGETVVSKTKDVGGQVVSKGKEFTSNVSESVRGATKGRSAEEIAHQAGEAIGKAIHKTVAVAKEISSGLRSGLNPEKKEEMPPEMESRQAEMRTGGREVVQRESYVRESPTTEERKVQETRKKENM